MNQSEMVKRLAWEFNLPKAEARRIFKFFLGEIKKDLMVGERIYFRGFGSFEKVKREARDVRHPETGEMMTIPEHFTVKFNPSKSLEEMIDERKEKR